MPYQPTNPYPYNTAIDLDDGLQFRFKADNYDVITSFEIEIYDLLKNKKLYTIVRCLGEISDDTIVKGNEQLLQIFNENNEQIYLDYFTEDCGTLLPLKSKRNGLNIGELDLSKFLATIEQLEKQKYYSEVDNAENLTITNSEAFVINEDGIIVEYLPSVLSEEEQTNVVIPYEITQTVDGVTTKTKVRGIASGVFGTRTLITNTTETETETTKSATATSISLLETIIIPSCVISIGDDNENSIGAFEECSNLTKVTFNYGITKIGVNTFKKCSALQQINLLDSISEIGVAAFQGCSNLTHVNLPSELKEIKANCFNGAGLTIVDLPEYVSYIGISAFANCKNLININTTSNLKEIGQNAFENCVELVGKTITITENGIETQKQIFSIVEGLQIIGTESFKNCSKLSCIELPQSIQEIGYQAFYGDVLISAATLPFVGKSRNIYENNWTMKGMLGYIFGGESTEEYDLQYLSLGVPKTLTTITITDETVLPIAAFQDCKNLERVLLSDNTTTISDYCFAKCVKLKNFVCPSSLSTIGKYAFSAQGKVLGYHIELLSEEETENIATDITTFFNISFTNIANSHDLKIGEYAFAFREDIISLKIPNFTSEIGESAFYKAFVSDKSVSVSLEMPYLNPENGFEGLFRDKVNFSNIVYPLGLTKIIINKVKGNKDLQVEGDEKVVGVVDNEIAKGSFNVTATNNIEEIELPDEVTSIGEKAFYSIKFTTFTMPFNVKSIGKSAFNFELIEGKQPVLYWTTLLDKDSDLIKTATKESLFGGKLTACYGNKGVTIANEEKVAQVYNPVDGDTINTNTNTITIKKTGETANFSAPACLFGINNVTPISGACGDYLTYEIKKTEGILNIKGSGAMWDFTQEQAPWYAAIDSITTINFPQSISKIGNYAFYNFSQLTTLNFIDSTIDLEIGEYAFSNCTQLTALSLFNNVKKIKSYAFENCNKLSEVKSSENAIIEKSAFYGCSNIQKISFSILYNENNQLAFTHIGHLWGEKKEMDSTFDETLYIKYNTYFIPCSLKEVEVFKGEITSRFFELTSKTYLDRREIREDIFNEHLAKVIYNSITLHADVEYSALALGITYCLGLIIENLRCSIIDLFQGIYGGNSGGTSSSADYNSRLPFNVVRIKYMKLIGKVNVDNFLGISYNTDTWKDHRIIWSLGRIKFAKDGILDLSETNITNTQFRNCYCTYGQEPYDYINIVRVKRPKNNIYSSVCYEEETDHMIGKIILPNSITEVLSYMFDIFAGVKEIRVNEGYITSVNNYGCYGCSKLTSIDLYFNTYKFVGTYGFAECINLSTPITSLYGIQKIQDYAFYNCKNIPLISSSFASTLTQVGEYAFYNCQKIHFMNISVTPDTILNKYSFCGCSHFSLPTNYIVQRNLPDGVFFGCSNLLNNITELEVVEGVTTIGAYSLGDCNLTNINLPTTIKEIGDGAFFRYAGDNIILPFIGSDRSGNSSYYDTVCAIIFGIMYYKKYQGNSSQGELINKDNPYYYCDLISTVRESETNVFIGYSRYYWLDGSGSRYEDYYYAMPSNLKSIYINNFDDSHQLHYNNNDLYAYSFYNFSVLEHTYFKQIPTTIGENAYTGATATEPELWIETTKLKKTTRTTQLFTASTSISYTSVPLYLSREKEYYWDIKLLGDKYDVYITDNNTYEDKNSYLPTIYAPNFEGVEPEQQITIQGENTYLIDNIQTFKNEGKIYYRQSKGVMSGQLSYYGVANGTLNYFEDTQVYTVDEELFNVLPTEPVKFSTGSKYTSDTYVGTICVQNGEVVVKLDNETEYSRFEFGAAIALQNTIITQGSLPEGLLNVVKEGTKFTVSTDSSVQTVTAINDYFNITFTPGIKNTTSGYTNVQMTLADKDKALILPNDLTTKQVLIVINTIGDITMDGKKEEEIKQAKVDENLLSLMIAGETTFLLDNKEYIVRSIDKKNQIIIFSDTSERGYILPEERDKKQKIRLVSNYIDLASEDFDITNLVLTLNYINIYTVNKIENYAYTKENEYQIPTEDGEKLYLVTCEEVVNPTNFEVNDRSLEKNALLERQSMILTVKSTDGTAIPHLLVEGDSYYSIYSNCIKSPAYYFRTLNKEPISIKCNNKNVAEDIVNLNGGSATFVAETNNNISYYVWELYEYYIDDYILIDKKTDKYSSTIFYDYHMFKDNIKYKLKLTVVTKEGLHVSKEIVINVAFSEDLILQGAFVERDCLRQAIAIDLREARFRYKIPKNQLSGTLSYNKTDKEFIIEDGLKRLLSSSPLKFSIGDSFDINNYRGIISLQGGQIQVVLKEDIEGMSQESSKDTEQDTEQEQEQEQEQNNKYAEFENGVTITLQECYSICYICPFSKEESTTILDIYGTVKGFYVIRTIKDEPDTSVIVGYVNGFTSRFYDYSFQREETYEYSIVPIFNPAGTNTDNEEELVRGIAYKIKPYIRFNTQVISVIGTKTNFNAEDIELSELENCYKIDDSEFGRWYFKLNAEDKNVNVVTDKAVYENGYQFPSVNQTDRNYKTGNVTVMLGNYYQNEDKQWSYKDSIRLQNKFQEFANNGKIKMLRDEIGNVLPVDITLTSFDYLPQAVPTSISVTFEWTQVNSEDKLGVYDYRKAKELDKIYVLPFTTREDVLNKPLEVQGLYFEDGRRIVPSKELKLSGQGVEYDEVTGYITLINKAPKKAITVTIEVKNDESIKTTFVIPAIE